MLGRLGNVWEVLSQKERDTRGRLSGLDIFYCGYVGFLLLGFGVMYLETPLLIVRGDAMPTCNNK